MFWPKHKSSRHKKEDLYDDSSDKENEKKFN